MPQQSSFPLNTQSTGPADTKARPHRCNDHLEDLLQGLMSWPMDVAKPFAVYWECLKSQPGIREQGRYMLHAY